MKGERIPLPLDQGRHSESCMSYLYHHYQEHLRLLRSESDPLMTVEAERYACGFPLPEFQRDLCWTREQEVAFIESAWLELPLGSFCHHDLDFGSGGAPVEYSGWLVDGQQRLTTIQRYWDDEFAVFGLYFSELTKPERRRFMSIRFAHYELQLWEENAIRELYNRMAFGGVPHKESERA